MTRLVLRNGVRPEIVYPILIISIFFWLVTYITFIELQDVKERIPINCIYQICYIDSDSYMRFIPLAIICSIITICCFKFSKTSKQTFTNVEVEQ